LRILTLTILLFTLILVQADEQNMGLRIVCPCSVESISGMSASVSFGVTNDSPSPSKPFEIELGHTPGVSHYLNGLYPGHTERIEGLAGNSTRSYTLEIPFVLPDYGVNSDNEIQPYLILKQQLLSDDGELNWSNVNHVRLATIGVSSSQPTYSDGKLFFIGAPTMSRSGDQATVKIPKLLNKTDKDILVDEIYLGYTEDLEVWGQPYSLALRMSEGNQITVPAFGAVENIEFSGTYASPPDSRPYGYLFLRSTESEAQMYEYVDARGNKTLPSVEYLASSTDFLLDTDGDGVSDFQENLVGTNPSSANSTPGTAILDLWVMYSAGFADSFGGEPLAKITQDIEWSNQALVNSGINARYRLVRSEQIDIEEGIELVSILDLYREKSGVFEGADLKRQELGADSVMVYVVNAESADGDSIACGFAPMMSTGTQGDFANAIKKEDLVATIGVPCVANAFTHELGHNLGLVHSRAQGDRGGSFFWSRGHGVQDEFATLMAYPQAYATIPFLASTTQHYSNPEVLCQGVGCGVASTDVDYGANAALHVETVMYQAASLYGTLGIDSDGDGVPEEENPVSPDDSLDEIGSSDEVGEETDSGSANFEGKKYRWIKERKTQQAAQAYAESLGGHLAVINSAAEDEFVYSLVSEAALDDLGVANDGGGVAYVWLGGNDAESEGNWNWVNGEAFQYTNWGRAEPDNYLNQDGLALGLENWPKGSSGSAAFGLAGQWNDISRSNQLTFIVELSLDEREDSENSGNESDDEENDDSGSNEDSDDNTATISDDFAFPYLVGLSGFMGCAIDDNDLQCWGNTDWLDYDGFPTLLNPTHLAVDSSHACALDDNGVVCWGYNGNGETDVPVLSNPTFVTSKYGTSCALDDTGVVCWGVNDFGQVDVPALSNPREVAIGYDTACALDDSGVVCWGDTSRSVASNIPSLVNPSQLTIGDLHGCVNDNDRVICWANGFSPANGENTIYNQPSLSNPTQLVAGGYHVCAIDDFGLQCWGRDSENQLDTPPLTNPSRLYPAGQQGMCAMDDNGLSCWGGEDYRSIDEVPTSLSFVSAGQRVVSQFLQTTSASQNITTLNVVNTSDTDQTLRGILRSSSGEKVGADKPILGRNIPPMGRLRLDSADLENIFGIDPWRGPAMLTVRGDSTFDLMSKLESPSGLISNTNCVRDNRVLNLEGFDSNNMSYVRFINTSAKSTKSVTGTLYDKDGNVVGDGNAELFSKLDPYQQAWINRNQLASIIGAEWNGEGMLEISPHPGLKVLNLNYITDEKTFFNFSCGGMASQVARLDRPSSSAPINVGRVYLQTTSSSKNVSLTHLVNTSGEAQDYIGTLYASDGSILGEANQSLHTNAVPSKGRLVLSSTHLENVLGTSAWKGPAMLEVKGDGLFELMTKLESPSGLISNTNCVRTDQVHNIGGFDQTDVTYIRFINIGNEPIFNIRGSLYDDSGKVVGVRNAIVIDELSGKAQAWRSRNQLSDIFGESWNGTVSLKVDDADENLRLLNLNFINSETFFNFSCYETGQ